MSQFEWLLTVAAYLLVAGIIFAAVLFVAYQRRRPASNEEGENTGDLANMMILLQTMRDMLEEQKTLARQFNQNFEQKLGHMEEKNRAARQRADELEQRAAKLEGRLRRVREELAVLHGEIEAASRGAAQERAPGPLKFSQAGSSAGATPSTPEPPAPEEPQKEGGDDSAHRQDDGRQGMEASLEASPREDGDESVAQAPLSDRSHEHFVDASAPTPDETPEIAEPSRSEPDHSAEVDAPPHGRMPWDWRATKAEAPVEAGDEQDTQVKPEEAEADSSDSEGPPTTAHEDEFPPRERPALHILASPDGEDDEDEPEESDAADCWVEFSCAGPFPPSAYGDNSVQGPGHKTPEPSDPEAARQAFRALLNMGQDGGAGIASRTETLDQPSASDAGEGPLRSRVYEYSDAGMSIAEIASELGIGKGEVRLILSLREQGGR